MTKSQDWPNSMEDATARKYTGVELRTLRVRGGGPPYVKRGRSVRYLKSDLDKWLESLKVRNTAEASERSGRQEVAP